MPLLAAFLGVLWGKLVVLLGLYFTKKAAAITATAAALFSLVTVAYTAISGLAAGLVGSLPAGGALGIWLFVPDNAGACVTACIAADAACALYRLNREYLRLAAVA